MKNFKLVAAVAIAAACLASCSKGARVSGVVDGDANDSIEVRLLDVNVYKPIDTVSTNASGAFSFTVPVEKGKPEFVYLFRHGNHLASLLLQHGDKVSVDADTLGRYSVSGSAESEKLVEVERAESEFENKFQSTVAKLSDQDPSSPEAEATRRDLAKQYIAYYRDRVIYVMKNSKSLTTIPVLYQTVGDTPLFGQVTDAIHFRNAYDSLMTVYPESRYVKALGAEADKRQAEMGFYAKAQSAPVLGFPDITLPGIDGKPVALSSLKDKMILVYFWSTEKAAQSMLNLELLKPLYEKYHDKGLEIYAVSLDTDKTSWATVVRNQGLEWINVCDGLGWASPSVTTYNVGEIPFAFLIKDGDIVANTGIKDEKTLERYLSANL